MAPILAQREVHRYAWKIRRVSIYDNTGIFVVDSICNNVVCIVVHMLAISTQPAAKRKEYSTSVNFPEVRVCVMIH